MNNETIKQLRAPFPSSAIQWRVGSTNSEKTRGKALPYIDARVVQNRLDDTVGAGNWKNRYNEVIVDGKLLGVRCALAVKIDGDWVEKEDGAHLDNIETFDQAEKAIKGVYSDALKRAAVQWGIGRYLYEFDAPWVEIENGRLLQAPRLPNEMLPENEHVAASVKRTDAKPATETKQTAEVKADVKPTAAPAPAAEAKSEANPESKQEAKPAAAPAPAAEVKPEAKPEPKQEAKPTPAPAPQQAPAPQADPAREVLNPQGTAAGTADDDRRARADEMADAAAAKQPAAKADGTSTPAEAPAQAPAPAAASSNDSASDDGEDENGVPKDLSGMLGDKMQSTADQRKLVDEMLAKMDKLPVHMLRNYIDGPKGKDKFTEKSRVFLLKKLAQKEAVAA